MSYLIFKMINILYYKCISNWHKKRTNIAIFIIIIHQTFISNKTTVTYTALCLMNVRKLNEAFRTERNENKSQLKKTQATIFKTHIYMFLLTDMKSN